MRYLLVVCLCALTIPIVLTSASAQSPALRQGISVQLAPTSNAVAFPAADNEDAWIIAITADGRLFFGVKPVTAEQLTEEMTTTPRRRDANLYVKVDGRAPLSYAEKALHAARADGFDSVVLLTDQHESSAPGKLIPPEGLEVMLGAPTAESTVIHLRSSAQSSPAVRISNQVISMSQLGNALAQVLQGKTEKVVSVQVENLLPFAQVARVIDSCRSLGAKVFCPFRKSGAHPCRALATGWGF